MTTDSDCGDAVSLSEMLHRHCIVCGAANRNGLRLEFVVCSDGSVKTVFDCASAYQGYAGVLHGGIISCLLDGAMTNCLFANGVTATTGELNVRYLHQVRTDQPAVVRAHIERARPPLYLVEAELSQEDKLLVRGKAKFMASASVVANRSG